MGFKVEFYIGIKTTKPRKYFCSIFIKHNRMKQKQLDKYLLLTIRCTSMKMFIY